ncbi:serine/threonine-protein kinase Nek11-like isoform X4 [Crassostrea angulata]|uniref:serine/threonine-protein kinase Nek11-like isoform X4 n=1 Tax=Magallana angulata TaxID=2784310 RepID=UPI00148ADC79|nr:serine/threonine-protein kinase Nek11 isoform X3 [Crassostrea gigas]XP_052714284.1 serine/threonine-protein kinase Nek11-like isoform X4 [Crassostrea angulata]
MSYKKKESSKKTPKVLANRYEIVKKLGKGNFGTAYLCKDLRSKNPETDEYDLKVLKEISVGELQPDETVDAVREARVLSKLDHPSIVKFHDSFIDGESFCIVTEFCEGGDLDCKINECVKNKQEIDSKLIMDWFVQLLLAVHYMHQRRVLHRDLKTRNIFLRQNMIKVGDFGISRILMGTTDLASTFTGTPYYMSPEVLKHEGYNSKSDIWSIGCILYEMCTLTHAFDGKSLMAVMYKIVEGEVPKLPEKFSSELNNVLKLMLSKDPDKRPSATDLLKIPLIKNHIAKLSKEFHAKSLENSSRDAEDIAKLLKEKSYLSDLKSTEEEVKYKNLPPRERMRLRKLQQADEEAKRLREVAKVQLKENQERNSRIQSTLHKSSVPAWAGGSGEGERFKQALTVKGRPAIAAEGIPDNPELADTYYSQFENDFSGDESDSDEAGDTVIERTVKPKKSPVKSVSNSKASSNLGTLVDDEDQLYNIMQDVLAKGDDAESTMSLADDREAGAFGPVVRDQKIKNLTKECKRILGEEAFQKAYDYLKQARYLKTSSVDSEETIMQGLREFVKNPSDCFLVDQLLFLEEQAKIPF